MTPRERTNRISAGPLTIGGGAPVSVQTMSDVDTRDVDACVSQALGCFDAGAGLVRFAVPDADSARALGRIKTALGPLRPVVADIHFDYRLALASIEAGADGLRLNPGNIGAPGGVREVARAAAERGVPIRVGVNAGSLDRDLLDRHGGATAEALVESALREIALLEDAGCSSIAVSVKASDLPRTVEAYRLLSARTAHPLHLGLTEAGTLRRGTVASSAALGILLHDGIGDTVRVSLTAPPAEEVRVGVELLRALGLRGEGASVTSCPGCGRTRCDLAGTASRAEAALEALYRAEPETPHPKVAVMGCVVNGPGEARDADIALVGFEGGFVLYEDGRPRERFPEAEAASRLVEAVRRFGRKTAGTRNGARTE